jgi:hypothetical protein
MTYYTVRVELHEAEGRDYEILHRAMESAGFKTTVRDTKHATYQLPPGEYSYYTSAPNRIRVLGRAKMAANATKLASAILVTQSDGRVWDGLKVLPRKVTTLKIQL